MVIVAADGDMETQRPGKGCLLGACGCLTAPLLVLLATAVLAVWFLSRWDPTQKAWDNLPPETMWAVQAHDLRSLLQAATRDPGAMALLSKLDAYLDRELGPDTGGINDFLSVYEHVGFLHTMVAPNSLVLGGWGWELDEVFLIFRSPTWLRWLIALPWSGFDSIWEADDGADGAIFLAARNGWIIVAREREVVQRVIDGWEKRAMPLGNGSKNTGAHIAFAMRRGTAKTKQETPPPMEPSHFTLADPFAVPAAAPLPSKAEGMFLRLDVSPAKGTWFGNGHIDGDGDGALSDAGERIMHEITKLPSPKLYDVRASVRLSPEVRSMALRAIRDRAKVVPPDLVRWLEKTGDIWTVLAAEPAVSDPRLPYPPLPVFSLGWTMRPEADPAAAAGAFTDSLAAWFDSLKTGDGPVLLQNLRQSLSYSLVSSPDAPGGDLHVPSVMVNAARPGWRFLLRQTPATGWFATDPAGIPDIVVSANVLDEWLEEGLEPPAAGHALFSFGWNLEGHFFDSLLAVVRDRLANHPAAPGGGAEKAERFLDALKTAATAYPRGSIAGGCDVDGRRAEFVLVVPAGVDGK